MCEKYLRGYSDLLWVGTFHWECERIDPYMERVAHSYSNFPDLGSNFDPKSKLTSFPEIFRFLIAFLDELQGSVKKKKKNTAIIMKGQIKYRPYTFNLFQK